MKGALGLELPLRSKDMLPGYPLGFQKVSESMIRESKEGRSPLVGLDYVVEAHPLFRYPVALDGKGSGNQSSP